LDANTTTRAGFGQPALVGGAVMGVLSALPFINVGNVCCCLWVVSGGLVAAYMLQQNQTTPITPGDGALVGLLAGIVGAFVTFVLSIPIGLLMEPMQRAMVQRTLEMAGSMPPEIRQILENYGTPRSGIGILGRMIFRVIGLFFMLAIGSIFSTLGGLLGAALFKKGAPPAPQPQSLESGN
jgi:Family of unknown function (DUF5518)